MKNYKFYDIKKTIKYTLIATSFFGTVFLTGCEKEAVNETTTIETVAQTRKPVVVKSKIIYETTTPSTTETPETTTVAPAPETTAEQSLEGQVEPETKETNEEEYNFPSEPEKFQSAEELVVFVEEDTKVLKKVIVDGNRTKYESKMVYLLVKMKNFSKEKESWNGINYSDLSQEQKQRYESCSSIWKDMLKDNVNDVGRSLKEAIGEFYGEDTDQVSENFNEIKDNFGQIWDATKKKGKEKYDDIKQGEAYQNADEKVKEIGGSLIEKAKQKMKK